LKDFKVGMIQMCSGEDKDRNLDRASRLLDRAVRAGAKVIVLPEAFNCLGRREQMTAAAEDVPGPTSKRLAEKARQHGIFIVGGSIMERGPRRKVYNTSLVFDRRGNIIGKYRKLHLFEAHLEGRVSLRESAFMLPGRSVAPVRVCGVKVGVTTCYDVRFPELYRLLTSLGAKIIFVPSAFTHSTGKDHWEVLLRARAIENQVYIVGVNQCGKHPNGVRSYGHSMVVDPWGNIIQSLDSREGTALACIDLDYLKGVRRALPVHKHARSDVARLLWRARRT